MWRRPSLRVLHLLLFLTNSCLVSLSDTAAVTNDLLCSSGLSTTNAYSDKLCTRAAARNVYRADANVLEFNLTAGQLLKGAYCWDGTLLLKRSGICLRSDARDNPTQTLLLGHTQLAPSSDGTMHNLQLMREHSDVQEARQECLPCLEIRGGPWCIEDCSARSQGGTAVLCAGDAAAAHLHGCALGGAAAGRLRAGEGLSARGRSDVRLSSCAFVLCLAAAVALDDARVRIDACSFRDVSYALCVDARGRLAAASCAAAGVSLGLLLAGSDAAAAAIELSHSTAAAVRLWFGPHRPGAARFENNTLTLGAGATGAAGARPSPLQASSAERGEAARARAAAREEAPRVLAAEYPGR
jgi:hypothetical protein